MLGFGAEETTISLMQIIGDDTLFIPYDSLINADTVISNKIDYFIFDGKKFDWINCDRFINEENLVDFNVIIDSVEYFTAYAVLNSYNSVLPIYENNSILKLPRNTMTTIVTLGYKDDKLCYGEEKVEIQDNGSVKVALIEKNSDYIKTRINQL